MAKNVDNQKKVNAGLLNNSNIDNELSELLKAGIIKDYKTEVNFSHRDYTYESQFLVNFLITTNDDKYIIIRSSTSFRQDRIKIPFYDFDGVVNHSTFSKNIIAAICVYADSEKGNTSFENIRKKIKTKEYYCPATHLLTISEFITFLEEYKYDILNEIDVEEDIEQQYIEEDVEEDVEEQNIDKLQHAVVKMSSDQGSFFGKKGNSYEVELVRLLADYNNLNQLKHDLLEKNHIFKLIIGTILSDRKIPVEDVIKIEATNTVPLLLSGGNAKTDIILTIETIDNKLIRETISIKNTTKDRVSCHDYSSKDFIRVLNCATTRLADYLNLFQEMPAIKSFSELLVNGLTKEEFTKLLSEKKVIFLRWVLTGEYDTDNLTFPELQVSRYLLLNKNDEVAFYSMNDYISIIVASRTKKTFGMPFGWTYPSKQRGKRIQLKVPVIMLK